MFTELAPAPSEDRAGLPAVSRDDRARGDAEAAAHASSPASSSAATPRRRGMSVIAAGRVIAPRSVPTVTGSPSATPSASARALPSRTTGGRAVPASTSSPSSRRPEVDQLVPGGQDRLAAAPGCGTRRPRRRSARPGGRPAGRQRAQLPADRVDVTGAERDAELRRRSRPAPGRRSSRVVFSTASKVRSRPSQSRKVPAFSTAAATGQHHVGAPGHRALPQLQADQERHRVERLLGQPRVGQVGRVDARRPAGAPSVAGRRPPR